MLTFFRKIRKSVLGSTGFGKYVLYAVGEILLVVVGILIALKINNWNQFQQDRDEEKRIYTSISDEIGALSWQAERGQQTYKNVVDAAENILFIINDPSAKISEDSLNQLFSIITSRWMFGVSNYNNIYDALSASGELKFIQSDQLRTDLMQMDRQIELLSAYEKIQMNFLNDQFYPILNQQVDGVKIYEKRSEYLVRSFGFDPAEYNLSSEKGKIPTSPLKNFRNKEFSNLLVNHIRNSAALVPIYERIKNSLSKIEEVKNEIVEK